MESNHRLNLVRVTFLTTKLTAHYFCGHGENRIPLVGFSVRCIHHVCHMSLKLIAESIGIEPNSELTERSRLAVCPYHHQGLLSIQTIKVYALHHFIILFTCQGLDTDYKTYFLLFVFRVSNRIRTDDIQNHNLTF